MNLLYCHIQFLDEKGKQTDYHNLEKVELNLSATDRFSFDTEKNILQRLERDVSLPADFWVNGEAGSDHGNIYNINVIAGENGSGKTTAIRCLMRVLDSFYEATQKAEDDVIHDRVLLLLYENEIYYLLHYYPGGTRDLSIQTEGFTKKQICQYSYGKWEDLQRGIRGKGNRIAPLLRKTKVIYMTNTLSQYDYERHISNKETRLRKPFIYDVSIGSTLGSYGERYFPYEVYKQVKYVFDRDQISKRKDIPEFTMPQVLRISLRIQQMRERFSDDTEEKEPSGDTGQILTKYLGKLCADAFCKNLELCLTDNSKAVKLFYDKADVYSQNELKKRIRSTADMFVKIVRNVQYKGYIKTKITCATVLPNRNIVGGSEAGILWVWDAVTGQCLHVMEGKSHSSVKKDTITCVTACSDRMIISGHADHTLRVWDTQTCQCVRVISGHTGSITGVEVLPDRNEVISCSNDGTVRIWNYINGKCLKIINVADDKITCMAVSPDGKSVGVAVGRTLHVFDVLTGECLYLLREHERSITCVAAISNDRYITGSDDKTLRIWDIRMENAGQCVSKYTHTNKITGVVVFPDGHAVASSEDDVSINWDASYGWSSSNHYWKITRDVYKAILSDQEIICISRDGRLWTWNTEAQQSTNEFSEYHKYLDRLDIMEAAGKVAGTNPYSKPQSYYDGLYGFAQMLMTYCLEYVDFIFEKRRVLFSRFTQTEDKNTFELSLKAIKETDMIFKELTEFVQKYRYTCEPVYTIDFDWGLSSGEENMLRIFSNLYFIFDRDYNNSEKYGEYRIYNYPSNPGNEIQECNTILLFMDEADLTLHPEWQRRLIAILTTFIPQIYPASCAKDIQLVLTTHSPLLLGDIPNENITYLFNRKGRGDSSYRAVEGETFGQNIHTILKENFFLNNGTVGAFAAGKINRTAKRLSEIKNHIGENTDDAEMEKILTIIDLVAPGVLRNRLIELYMEAMSVLNRRKEKDETDTNERRRTDELIEELLKLSPKERNYVFEQSAVRRRK